MKIDPARVGYGITGDLDPEAVRPLAAAVERAGMRTLWVNQPSRGDALETMAAAAEATSTLRVASGVLPVDHLRADDIVRRVRELQLPLDRIVLGVGASRGPSPLTTVRKAVATLRAGLGTPVVVGALGPRMRRLAARESDGLLLNWLTPSAARSAVADKDRDLADGGTDAGITRAAVALYVRCALGAEAGAVARREADRYAGIPSYAANFARLGFSPLESAVLADTPEALRAGLAPYTQVLDETVVRGVTASNTLAEHLALVTAVAGEVAP
jgi:alkanesulfonate monooxygenase SsuD/methylene tetrahydromethanopterin reductase-like flavin-dependent oxidoreductase (luciferase family)